MAEPIALGLWGGNGHQIHGQLAAFPRLRMVAFGGFDGETGLALRRDFPHASPCESFADLLKVPGLELVSLCSPLRSGQADQAIAALEAGIHVYAEKPCATTEADFDRLLAAVGRSSATFHEMAGTVCEQPFWAMRQLVLGGAIGEVIQVLAQKSYPYHPGRPLREEVDGGLIAQNGVHALRLVEHITGVAAITIEARHTRLGEVREASDLKMACALLGGLGNGGIFSVIANYLNPRGFGAWGNEMVRIFGTEGMIEAIDGGAKTRLITGDVDHGAIDVSAAAPDWLTLVLDDVRGCNRFPFGLREEVHPTRMVLRAAEKSTDCTPGGDGREK
jgi:predicted dehydrogenase